MIGARNRDMNDLWYAQAVKDAAGKTIPNSAIENMLMKDDIQDGDPKLKPEQRTRPGLWLESCKCHSHYNAALGTRKDPRAFEIAVKERLRGVRPPDYIAVWMNTPQNRGKLGLSAAADLLMNNEVSAYYPIVMDLLFGVKCTYSGKHTWDELVAALSIGYAIEANLEIGHSICYKGFDEATQELIYVDPDPPRLPAGVDWRNVRQTRAQHDMELKQHVTYYPPEI